MNKFILLPLAPLFAFSLELCDTTIYLNDTLKQKWGMQSEKVFNVHLQTYTFKTPEEFCKVYIDPSNAKVVKLQKRNNLPTVSATYPNIFQDMQFDFGELEYKDANQPTQRLKTESFSDFSETNLNFIDVILKSKAVYKNEKTGDRAYIETRCASSAVERDEDGGKSNCVTTFTLYSGEYLNKDKVQNKLFKTNVEKEIMSNVKDATEKN